MTLGFDNATEQVLNGTTEVQLNGGNPLTTPDKASQVVEVITYLTAAAAFAEDDGFMPFVTMTSDDVSIQPKIFSIQAMSTGNATTSFVSAPPIKAFPMNIDLATARQARVNYFANQQVAASTATLGVGVSVVYETNGVSAPEQFYQKPANETTMGTGDNTRTAGNDITITGGREVNYLSCQVGTQVGVASEHIVGFCEFSSSDFLTSMPYRLGVSPVFSGLGANHSVSGVELTTWSLGGGGIPIAGRTVINTFFTQNDASGSADDDFILGVGYIK